MRKLFLIPAFLILTQIYSQAQIINISEARQRPQGEEVTITGVITNGDELGFIRYIQDATAGLGIYDPNGVGREVDRGDSILITGVLGEFRGLLQIIEGAEYQIISGDNELPEPQTITPNQMGEDLEGSLVRIEGARFADAGGVFATNNTFDFTANGETSRIFVRRDHPLAGIDIPLIDVTLIGIVSEFEGQYQLILRGEEDIIPEATFFIDGLPAQSNISQTGFTVNWTTNEPGTTTVEYGTDISLGTVEEIQGERTDHEITLDGLEPATFYYVKAVSSDGNTESESPVYIYSTQSRSSGDIKVYFNHSVDPSYSNGSAPETTSGSGLNRALMDLIENAQETIDFAGYNNNRTEITRALNDAHNRGVRVRYIYDDSPQNSALLDGIDFPILNDAGALDDGLMHNKFVVVDVADENDCFVYTGSTNFTDENIGRDYNNALVIQDQSLARAYTLEFEEMWGGSGDTPGIFAAKCGSSKEDNTPHLFKIGDVDMELYFSPSDNTSNAIERAVRTADDQLMLALLTFTHNPLGTAVVDEFYDGTDVRVLLDNNSDQGSEYDYMQRNGVNVVVESSTDQLHHKYAIIDPTTSNPTVVTGSHNWSRSAEERNDENTLIIYDEDISNIFQQEFEKRWAESTTGLPHVDQIPGLDISVGPNPAISFIDIRLEGDMDDPTLKLQIFDLNGKLLQEVNGLNEGTNRVYLNSNIQHKMLLLLFSNDEFCSHMKMSIF
jgi:phosphatidylserine/phosphatidylglycerophosphate/cardiolipin synthase-like enzyme